MSVRSEVREVSRDLPSWLLGAQRLGHHVLRAMRWLAMGNVDDRVADGGYFVDNRETAPPRRPEDLPLQDVYEVLEGLEEYREPAMTSLAAVREPSSGDREG